MDSNKRTDRELLIRIDERLKAQTEMMQEFKIWTVEYEKTVSRRFAIIHRRIDMMHLYGKAVSIVSGFVAAAATYLWENWEKVIGGGKG